tara:strand:+ start:2283 stop:2912 length:630 start_codon:yes stop_codon:yes gene_type:complete
MKNIQSNIELFKREHQFFLLIILCFISFVFINILGTIKISQIAYSSGYLIKEPYRILLYNFVHKDLNHLVSNVFGIIIIRYCFIKLKIKSSNLFYYLTILIIFLQTFILYLIDHFLVNKYDYFLIGFSGIVFGVNAYLMLVSYFGSNKFFNKFISLKRNYYIFRLNLLILSFGFIYSLLPGVSLKGHLSGAISGLIIFYISKIINSNHY